MDVAAGLEGDATTNSVFMMGGRADEPLGVELILAEGACLELGDVM